MGLINLSDNSNITGTGQIHVFFVHVLCDVSLYVDFLCPDILHLKQFEFIYAHDSNVFALSNTWFS